MKRTMLPNIIKPILWIATLLALYLVPGTNGIDPRCKNVKCTRISSMPACQYSVEYMFEQANRVLVNRNINNWCCCSKADVRSNQKRKKKVHSLKRCFKEITHNLNHPPFEFPTDECCPTVLFKDFPACKDSPFRTTQKPDNKSTSTTDKPATSTTTTGKPARKSSGKVGATSSTTTKKPGDKSTTTTTTTTKGPAKSTTTKGSGKSTTTTKAATTTTDKGKSRSSAIGNDDEENEDDED